MSTFKERLEAFIKPKGFTVEQVAKLAGVSTRELNYNEPNLCPEDWEKVRNVLGIKWSNGEKLCDLPEPGTGEWEEPPCNDYTVTRTLSLWESLQPKNWDKAILRVGNDSYMTMRELKECLPGEFPDNLFGHLEGGSHMEIEENVFDQVEGWNVDLLKSALTLGDWELDRKGRLSWKGSVVMIVPPDRVLRWTRLIKKAYDGERSTKRIPPVEFTPHPLQVSYRLEDRFGRDWWALIQHRTGSNHAQRLDRYLSEGAVVPGETLRPKYVDEAKPVDWDAWALIHCASQPGVFFSTGGDFNVYTTYMNRKSFEEIEAKLKGKSDIPKWADEEEE